ncbi:hypothetical protein Zmor_023152 [Zophobas morio]|uniref:Uncharacterized protein n=1 Tax=Zophobas morio TaxID=2755281 RepID=A0AA38M7I9_9CUCU|nr:hypothetical protein Zmor_023152 [Zophobas morio]
MSNYYQPGFTILLVDTDFFEISYPVIHFNSSKSIHLFEYCYPQIYIINLKTNQLHRLVNILQDSEIFNPRAYFVIISDHVSSYDDFFQQLSSYFIYKVVLLDTSDENLITYDPYVHENVLSQESQPMVLGPCNNVFLGGIFNKTLPLLWRNTTIEAVYTEHFPYLYYDKGKRSGENFKLTEMIREKLMSKVNSQRLNETNSTDINGWFGY